MWMALSSEHQVSSDGRLGFLYPCMYATIMYHLLTNKYLGPDEFVFSHPSWLLMIFSLP
jgi:hypothetical protein